MPHGHVCWPRKHRLGQLGHAGTKSDTHSNAGTKFDRNSHAGTEFNRNDHAGTKFKTIKQADTERGKNKAIMVFALVMINALCFAVDKFSPLDLRGILSLPVCSSRLGHTDSLSPDSFQLQRRRICTTQSACPLMNSRSTRVR